MNIEDKSLLYAEIRRVLRTGGTFAMHDVEAGPVQPIVFTDLGDGRDLGPTTGRPHGAGRPAVPESPLFTVLMVFGWLRSVPFR